MPNVSHENQLIFMRMTVQVTFIFIQIVSLKDSFCHSGKSKLGIGLFIHELLREPLILVNRDDICDTWCNEQCFVCASIHIWSCLVIPLKKLYTLNVWSRGKQFCFPKNPDASRDEVEGNIATRGKTKLTSFQRGPYIKCFVIYLDSPLNNHIAKANKQRQRAGNNGVIVSRSGYI